MDLGIEGRVALVTGAGRGIGAEICRTLGAEGVLIAVNDLFQDRADETAAAIEASGGRAIGVAADVTNLGSITVAVARVADSLGPIDILVNNAGIPAVTATEAIPSTGGFFGDSDRAAWDRAMGLITYGVLNCSRAVIGGMQERRWGRIVNIISDAGRVGEPRLVAYSMAKAGVIGFSRPSPRKRAVTASPSIASPPPPPSPIPPASGSSPRVTRSSAATPSPGASTASAYPPTSPPPQPSSLHSAPSGSPARSSASTAATRCQTDGAPHQALWRSASLIRSKRIRCEPRLSAARCGLRN